MASVLDKTELLMVRMLDDWTDTLTVSLASPYPPGSNLNTLDDYIASWRVQVSDNVQTVTRTPGSGQPSDCTPWTSISLKYLSAPMDIPSGTDTVTSAVTGEFAKETISGVTYPVMTGGPGITTLTGTFSGAYTKILFPCDRVQWLQDDGYGEDQQQKLEQNTSPNEDGLTDMLLSPDFPKRLPDGGHYDHLTEFRPDPTQFVTLTYTIVVNLVLDGVPVVETHTLTHKVENNPLRNPTLCRTLVEKQTDPVKRQTKYNTGRGREGYDPFELKEA